MTKRGYSFEPLLSELSWVLIMQVTVNCTFLKRTLLDMIYGGTDYVLNPILHASCHLARFGYKAFKYEFGTFFVQVYLLYLTCIA